MKIEKYGKKLVGNDEERAVSPVIGVILMVAITVILAAVIAAFVLDLGQSTGANPQAGLQFDEGTSGVDVTLISIERVDDGTIDVQQSGGCGSNDLENVGDTVTCPSTTDDITVTAQYDGNEAVIATWGT